MMVATHSAALCTPRRRNEVMGHKGKSEKSWRFAVTMALSEPRRQVYGCKYATLSCGR